MGIFGLSYTEAQAGVVLVPVPWEATTSYGGGTSLGPSSILRASQQVDLYDVHFGRIHERGLFMMDESNDVRVWNERAKRCAKSVTESLENDRKITSVQESLDEVNELGGRLNRWVYENTRRLSAAGKLVGIVGGDHSVPFGAFQAVAEVEKQFGILHIDAHSDTRRTYQGFTWSHASIMFNVLDGIAQVEKLVQVAVRDICEEEWEFCKSQGERVETFYDADLARRKFEGSSWSTLCAQIVSKLPERVWVSFDIDGLEPSFCPNTGTPVPGGLHFNEADFLLLTLARSGRKIIGFDLCEVAPSSSEKSEWDANVGARMLYKLVGSLLSTHAI